MKIALTVWDGWISPVFDVCREVLVLEIDKKDIVSTEKIDLGDKTPLQKIERLTTLGVGTLVCGAISEVVRAEAAPCGLKVIGFVSGRIDEVVQALISDRLPTPALSMPGCREGRGRKGGRNKGSC
jgi:predicted Fe-Mo cluster-binding NifX family protein